MAKNSTDSRIYNYKTLIVVIGLGSLGFFLMVLPIIWGWPHEGTRAFISRDLGLAFLISGIVGTGYEVFTRRVFMEDVENTLDAVVSRRYEELDKARMSGLKTVHREKFYARVEARFRDAKRSVRVLQTWSGEFNSLGSSLIQAAERGCDVRILLLDPDSEHAKHRGIDLKHGEEKVRMFIDNDLTILSTLRAKSERAKRNIEVRLYRSTPVIAVHGWDDTNVVGTYWCGKHSQEGPQYEVVGRLESGSDDPYLAEAINEHFNNLWKHATEYEWPQSDGHHKLETPAGREPRASGVAHGSNGVAEE